MEKIYKMGGIGGIIFSLVLFLLLLNFIFLQEEHAEVKSQLISDPQPSGKLEEPIPSTPVQEFPDPMEQELDCLATNIYHESRGDSLAGQAAVADVVMNRVEEDNYPNTVCGVVQQAVWVINWKGNIVPERYRCQFSWFCDGVSDEPTDMKAWIRSYKVAMEVYKEGSWRGITEGSTHYHAAHMRANWAQDRGMEYKGTIGQHEFYKWNR